MPTAKPARPPGGFVVPYGRIAPNGAANRRDGHVQRERPLGSLRIVHVGSFTSAIDLALKRVVRLAGAS
jgi:hypothetical protein